MSTATEHTPTAPQGVAQSAVQVAATPSDTGVRPACTLGRPDGAGDAGGVMPSTIPTAAIDAAMKIHGGQIPADQMRQILAAAMPHLASTGVLTAVAVDDSKTPVAPHLIFRVARTWLDDDDFTEHVFAAQAPTLEAAVHLDWVLDGYGKFLGENLGEDLWIDHDVERWTGSEWVSNGDMNADEAAADLIRAVES